MSEKIKSIDPFGSNTIKSDVKDNEGESNKVITFEEGSIEQSKSKAMWMPSDYLFLLP